MNRKPNKKEALGKQNPELLKHRQATQCIIERNDFHQFMQNLPPSTADLVLTDPPYTISKKTGFQQVKNGVKRFAVNMEFGKWDLEPINLDILCTDLMQVLKTGGTAIVWYDFWKLSHLAEAMQKANFKMLRVLIWEKTNPVPLNMGSTYLSNPREIAVVGVKGGKPTFHGSYDNGVYRLPIPRHNGKRVHPTQKPLGLFENLVEKHSNQGDLVIDPFLGGGTTAIACHNKDRRFAGCDKDSKYVKSAKDKLNYV